MKFENLISCYHISEHDNNQIVYDKLVEQLRKQNITPLIGAGLSSWAYPLWGQMLSELANSYGIKTEVDTLLNDKEYEEAASLLEKKLTANGLINVLQHIFDPNKLEEKAAFCPAYLRNIPILFHGPIITTNFDRMIEYLFTSEGKKCPACVTPQNSFQDAQTDYALHMNAPILVKMHGDINDPNHMILTKESYDDSYGCDPEQSDFTRPMPAFLEKILKRNPLLFLGCSLGADRTCTVIRKCAPNHQHFAFLELPEKTEAFEDRRNEIVGDFNILPIWYPHGMHEEALHAFFTKLCEDLNVVTPTLPPGMDGRYVLTHPLLGRNSQVDSIVRELTDNQVSCVWVVGPAGIGKTETCKAVYASLSKKVPSLIMPYIDLTGITNLPAFFNTLADELKISIPGNIKIEDIGSYLIARLEQMYPLQRTNKILRILYIDNWEDIWYGLDNRENREPLINWIKKLVDRKFKLLVSSRELPPSAPDSVIFRIEPLDSGKLNHMPLTDNEFDTLDSVELFHHIIGRDVTQNERGAFSSLICQLEGHPLSIVLTATQVREGTTINKLLNRWDKAKQDTTGIPDKFYNLEVALKVSWNAISTNPEAILQWGLHYYSLKPIPERVFVQLRGDASEEAWDEGLRILSRANLVYTIPDSESVAMLLPLKKQFAHLTASDKSLPETCLFRWAQYIENMLDQANQRLSKNRQQAHYDTIELIPQIFYIMEQLMAYGKASAKEHLDLIVQKVRLYYHINLQSESILEKLKDYYKDSNSLNLLAIIYNDYGVILKRIGNIDDAKKAYDQAERLFLLTGDRQGLANLYKHRGNLLKRLGNIDDANKFYDRAEALMREIHDDLGLADLLKSRGDLARRTGNVSDAFRFYDSAEPLYCQIHDNLGLADLRKSRGDALKELDDLEGAKAAYNNAEALYREEHNDLGLADLFNSRGDLLMKSGDVDGAKRAFISGERLYREMNDDDGLADILKPYGDLLRDTGDLNGAQELYDKAEAIYRQTCNKRGLANLYKSRGDFHFQRGNTEEAWEAYSHVESLCHKIHEKPGLANLHKSQGDLAMYCNSPEQAYIFYKKAEELYQELGNTSQRVSTLAELCKCCRQLGKISEAEAIEKTLR